MQLQVCTREAFFNNPESNPLLHCVDVPKGQMPGPFVAELPPGEIFDVSRASHSFFLIYMCISKLLYHYSLLQVVIVARNFIDKRGDIALIDNIRVDYILCPSI